jgi:hypothetical protein
MQAMNEPIPSAPDAVRLAIGEACAQAGEGSVPTVESALERIREELSRSIRQGEACDALHERVGGLLSAYHARLARPGELVFRVDALLVEYGCRPWSIERRGFVDEVVDTELAA